MSSDGEQKPTEITTGDAQADAASKPYILITFAGKDSAVFDYVIKDINEAAQLPAVVTFLESICKMEIAKLLVLQQQMAAKEKRSGIVIPTLVRQ